MDESVTFIASLIRQKGSCFIERGQNADGVQKNTPEKFMILGASGGRDVQFTQFIQRVLVDEVTRLQCGKDIGFDLAGIRDGDGHKCELAQIPSADGAFATARCFDESAVIDGGHAGICGVVFGPASDVFAMSVAELGGDFELHRLSRLGDQMRL